MAALQVELVGGDGALAILLTLVGPAMIAGAAVVAAFVARRTANERQAKQLQHDTERQREQLAHDTDRQERELEHDRHLRDREYLFRTVSTAFEDLERAKSAVIETAGWIGSLESAREQLAGAEATEENSDTWLTQRVKDLEREVASAMDVAHPATMNLWADTALLELFLGQEDDVVLAHIHLAEKTRAWYDSVKQGYYRGNRSAEGLAHSKRAEVEVRSARRCFEEECRKAFGWDGEWARSISAQRA